MKKVLLAGIFLVAAFPALSSAQSASCPNLSRSLFQGVSGSDVRELQLFFIARGLLTSDSATGYFGSLTESAAKAFQASQGVENTGYVGPQTRAAIARACGGQGGQGQYGSPAPTCSVILSNSAPKAGEPFTLQWTSQNATYMTGLPGVGQLSPVGSQTITETTPGAKSYYLSFVGPGGSSVCQAGLMVVASTVTGLSASPSSGEAPLSVTFTLLNPESGAAYFLDFGDSNSTSGVAFGTSMTHTYSAVGNYTARLIASNSTIATRNITVNEKAASAPTCTLRASKTSVGPGESVTLTWSSTNATGGNITGGVGSVSASGSRAVSPGQTTTYLAVFSGSGGSQACDVTVNVDTVSASDTGYLCGARVATCGGCALGQGKVCYGDMIYVPSNVPNVAAYGEPKGVKRETVNGVSAWTAPYTGSSNVPCKGVEIVVNKCVNNRPTEITCPSGYGGFALFPFVSALSANSQNIQQGEYFANVVSSVAGSSGHLVSCVKGLVPPKIDPVCGPVPGGFIKVDERCADNRDDRR